MNVLVMALHFPLWFVTLVHEISHGLATLALRGSCCEIVLYESGEGKTDLVVHKWPRDMRVVLLAGQVGPILLAAIFLLASFVRMFCTAVILSTSAILFVITLKYGKTELVHRVGFAYTIVFLIASFAPIENQSVLLFVMTWTL